MKRILLTGGTGFIGKNISPFLRLRYQLFSPFHHQLNLLDAAKVQKFITENKIDYVIHAANVGGTRDQFNLKDVVYTNLTMFFNIVRNINYLKKIIYFGSGAEYDKRQPIIAVKEEQSDRRVPVDAYGFYKYICAKYTQALNSDRLCCLRLFGIYGPHENYLIKFISNAIVKNLLHQDIVINQDVLFDYLYVADLIPILDFFLNHKGKYSIYNVSTGEKISLTQIVTLINRSSAFQSKITVKNKELNNEYTASNKRLIEEISDLKITPIKQGIKKLFNWYNKNLDLIDKSKVIEDKYAKLCVVKS